MRKVLLSRNKIKAVTGALFLVGLAILSFTGLWWPGIMLVIGIPLALRQYFLAKYYDMGITLIVVVGVFVVSAFSISEKYFLPVLFIVGAIYIFFREYFQPNMTPEDELEEEINEEIEEDQQDKKR